MVAPAESSNRSVDEHFREAYETIQEEARIVEHIACLEVEECTRNPRCSRLTGNHVPRTSRKRRGLLYCLSQGIRQ